MDVKNNEHLAQDVQNTELERLLSLLKSQAESNGLRRAVAQTIAGLGEIAIIPLLEAAKDTNSTVRVEALLALANLLRRIKHDKSNLSISTEIQVFEAFVEALKDVNSRVRAMAAREIIYHRPYDKRAVEPLITCLEDKNPRVRNIAIHNLGKIGDSRAVQALLNLITDKEKLDENVMDALSCTKDTRAVEPILEILLDKANSPKLRNSAAYALGNLGYTRVTQPLLSILSDTQDSARSAVAWALGQLREPQAIEPLIEMLKDKDKYLRESAAHALYYINDQRVIEPLIEALKDDYADLRFHAIRALGKIGDERVLPILEGMQQHDNGEFKRWESGDGTIKEAATSAILQIKKRQHK